MEKASKSNNYYYNKELLPFARKLRQNYIKSEACAWEYLLKNKQFRGFQFLRQRPILNYIADFVCLELMLIIEIDGATHDNDLAILKDKNRDEKLEEIGFSTLRFSSWEVLNRIDNVSIQLEIWYQEFFLKNLEL